MKRDFAKGVMRKTYHAGGCLGNRYVFRTYEKIKI